MAGVLHLPDDRACPRPRAWSPVTAWAPPRTATSTCCSGRDAARGRARAGALRLPGERASPAARTRDATIASRIADLEAVLAHLATQPELDGRFGLLGSSLGGFVALLAPHRRVASGAPPLPVVTWNAPADRSPSWKPATYPGHRPGAALVAEVRARSAGRGARRASATRPRDPGRRATRWCRPAHGRAPLRARRASRGRLHVIAGADHRLTETAHRREAVEREPALADAHRTCGPRESSRPTDQSDDQRGGLEDEFLELVSISSLSRRRARSRGGSKPFSRAWARASRWTGRGRRSAATPATSSRASRATRPVPPPFLLSGHMDTVGPAAEAIHPVVEGDVIRTDAPACSGGDDKAGRGGDPRGDPRPARARASRTATSRWCSRSARRTGSWAPSTSTPAGSAREAGPRARRGRRLRARSRARPRPTGCPSPCTGLEAHAGICPERGISAIAGRQRGHRGDAARPRGRGDHREPRRASRAGSPPTSCPARSSVRGETRSLSRGQARGPDRAHADAASTRRRPGTRVTLEGARVPRTRRGPGRAPVRAARHRRRRHDRPPGRGRGRRAGARLPTRATGGGSDANVFVDARARGRQPRLRHARDPHRERVGGRARPRAHRRARRRDRSPQRRGLTARPARLPPGVR